MKKIFIVGLIIVASVGVGALVGQKMINEPCQQPNIICKDTAEKIINSLQDEQFLQECSLFAKEASTHLKRFSFEIVKTLKLSESQLKDLQACVAGYQSLNDMFDGVNIGLVQQAWKSVKWDIIDGSLVVNPTSLNLAAKKLAGQDSIIAPRLKKIAVLNARWAENLVSTLKIISSQIEQNQGSLFLPYINFNTALFKILKKYPKVQSLLYQVHACMQLQQTHELFVVALKDELIDQISTWLPKTWPYVKSSMQESGELIHALLTQQIKYVAKQSQKPSNIKTVK